MGVKLKVNALNKTTVVRLNPYLPRCKHLIVTRISLLFEFCDILEIPNSSKQY